MSVVDALNIDTIFRKKNKRTILCKNSYERMLVHKFAREHGLKSETITMPETHKRLLCPACMVSLDVGPCNCCYDGLCGRIYARCLTCKYDVSGYDYSELYKNKNLVSVPVKAVVLSRKKVARLPRAFSDVTIITQS